VDALFAAVDDLVVREAGWSTTNRAALGSGAGSNGRRWMLSAACSPSLRPLKSRGCDSSACGFGVCLRVISLAFSCDRARCRSGAALVRYLREHPTKSRSGRVSTAKALSKVPDLSQVRDFLVVCAAFRVFDPPPPVERARAEPRAAWRSTELAPLGDHGSGAGPILEVTAVTSVAAPREPLADNGTDALTGLGCVLDDLIGDGGT
jgi:hypothetical protein